MPENSYYRTPEQEMAYHRYLAARREYDRVETLRKAAPDLLTALKLIMEEKAPNYHDCTDNGLSMCVWCIADEAIAKAEGSS